MTDQKGNLIAVRVSRAERQVIERAADIGRETVSSFLRAVVVPAAKERVVADVLASDPEG